MTPNSNQAAAVLMRFLPGRVVNNPSVLPEVIVHRWKLYKAHDLLTEISRLQHDANLLKISEDRIHKGSRTNLLKSCGKGITSPLAECRNLLSQMLSSYEEIIGSLTDSKIQRFMVSGAVAQVRRHFLDAGIVGTEASIWTAASAIHLGGIPTNYFADIGDIDDFVELNKCKGDRRRIRLCDAVRKACERYEHRIKEGRMHEVAKSLYIAGLHRQGLTLDDDLPTKTFWGFIDAEYDALKLGSDAD